MKDSFNKIGESRYKNNLVFPKEYVSIEWTLQEKLSDSDKKQACYNKNSDS